MIFLSQAILEGKATMDEPCLDNEECAVICEMLKVKKMELLVLFMITLHQVIFNLTVNCKLEDESDLAKVASTVNRLLRITIKVCESVKV